jgi:hypothetical protein
MAAGFQDRETINKPGFSGTRNDPNKHYSITLTLTRTQSEIFNYLVNSLTVYPF